MLRNEELDEAEAELAHIEKMWGAYQKARGVKREDAMANVRTGAVEWVNTWGRRLISDINERIDAEGERAMAEYMGEETP